MTYTTLINQITKSARIMLSAAAISLMIISFSESFAQERKLSEEQINQAIERMEATKERLNLTEEQKEKLEPVLTENIEESLLILQQYGFSEGGDRPKLSFRQKLSLRNDMKDLRSKTKEKVATILDEEQMAEYEKIQEERRAQMRERLKR